MPGKLNISDTGSLRLNLIDVLSQQLEAEYSYKSSDKGTSFTITFERDELKGIGKQFFVGEKLEARSKTQDGGKVLIFYLLRD